MRVAVALSGGVDSSVSAYILKQQGYDVVGISARMCLNEHFEQVIKNAHSVAKSLDIPFYSLDVSKDFTEKVINYFENSYKQGETPNPCVMCNKYIKWGALYNYALNDIKADYVATGHYANIQKFNNEYRLLPAKDCAKDQLYFLYSLTQEQLKKTLFPLYKYKKDEIKKIAISQNLPCKSSKESQDICFIQPPNTTKKYLNNIFNEKEGYFIDINSKKILGIHNGFWQYTIGQRKGIGIAANEPLYVVEIDPNENIVYLGNKKDLLQESLILTSFNWSTNEYNIDYNEFQALVKIRYNMKATLANIKLINSHLHINFVEPVSAIAKGQICVLYDTQDGHLIGGGII